jgi:eukaryotic-like serine/threonine-protein kinase
MATVYLAQDLKHPRQVALKVLRPEVGGALGADRFLREIELVSRLQHPHILGLLDSGSAGDTLYYVMPYIDGESLRHRLGRESQLPVEEAITLAREVAAALGYAHGRGIIHRDIKPENILLCAGHALVADFGIAKALDAAGGEKLTETGLSLGTPHYMSPEQASATRSLDGRSDIYALGCVLYEMLAGAPPFTGPSAQSILARHLVDPVPSLHTVRGTVPAGIEWAITKAMAKVPADRFATAADFAAALAHPERVPVRLARPPRLRRTILVGGAVAGLVTIAALLGIRDPGRAFPRSGSSRQIQSLAVLPLEDLSRDSTQAFFADGMTDQLITDLAQIRALRLISRSSVMRYRGGGKSAPEIARELHVDAVVTGTVQRSGDKVRIAAQLIPEATGQVMWAKGYDGELSDILSLQARIAQSIADEIKIEVRADERARFSGARQVDPDAHEAYLKGRYYWNKRTPENLKKAVGYFQQAIDIDPTYPLAYAGVADCYAVLGSWEVGAMAPRDAFPKAKAAARKALEIDSSLGEAHASLAFALHNYDWDWDGAEREFKRALQLNPSYATGHHWYSHFLTGMGRAEASHAEAVRALELDPLDMITNIHLGWHYLYAGQSDEAIRQFRIPLEMDSTWMGSHFYLGWAYTHRGNFTDAIAELQTAVKLLNRAPWGLTMLGYAYAKAGKRAEARQIIAELAEKARERYVSSYEIAVIYVGLGENDRAYQWFDKAYDERSGWLPYLEVEPRLAPLRSDPRFRELVRRVGLASQASSVTLSEGSPDSGPLAYPSSGS